MDMTRARCLNVDPELFFDYEAASVDRAKKICAGCPVAADCLAYSISTLSTNGIYGGKDETERRPMLAAERARRRQLQKVA